MEKYLRKLILLYHHKYTLSLCNLYLEATYQENEVEREQSEDTKQKQKELVTGKTRPEKHLEPRPSIINTIQRTASDLAQQ